MAIYAVATWTVAIFSHRCSLSQMLAGELVGWNVRRLRVHQCLSQERLAHEADVDRAYLGRLERGLENPTVKLLQRLGQTLSVSLAEFFVEPKPGEKIPALLTRNRRNRKLGSIPASKPSGKR